MSNSARPPPPSASKPPRQPKLQGPIYHDQNCDLQGFSQVSSTLLLPELFYLIEREVDRPSRKAQDVRQMVTTAQPKQPRTKPCARPSELRLRCSLWECTISHMSGPIGNKKNSLKSFAHTDSVHAELTPKPRSLGNLGTTVYPIRNPPCTEEVNMQAVPKLASSSRSSPPGRHAECFTTPNPEPSCSLDLVENLRSFKSDVMLFCLLQLSMTPLPTSRRPFTFQVATSSCVLVTRLADTTILIQISPGMLSKPC